MVLTVWIKILAIYMYLFARDHLFFDINSKSLYLDVLKIGERPAVYYRPQRSWGKVIFSEACVKNNVRGGVVSQHALQVSRPTPRGEVEGSGQGGL